jgi:hypothetical protein
VHVVSDESTDRVASVRFAGVIRAHATAILCAACSEEEDECLRRWMISGWPRSVDSVFLNRRQCGPSI